MPARIGRRHDGPTPVMSIDDRLAELGLTLPPGTTAIANYVPAARAGGLLYLSGHLSKRDGQVVTGKVGRDLGIDEGYELARLIGLDLLGTARDSLGSLDAVRGVVKLTGMVNGAEDFTDQPAVINGASDLLVAVFGECGRHARTSVGMAQLPLGAALEIELILDVG